MLTPNADILNLLLYPTHSEKLLSCFEILVE